MKELLRWPPPIAGAEARICSVLLRPPMGSATVRVTPEFRWTSCATTKFWDL